MPIVICKHCGAKYSYKEQSIQMRDKDYQRCEVCHAILKEWNGGMNYYDFELLSENEDREEENEK
ncbi:MAG TPA: hypothetical protein DIC64_04700 [Alphaproteobacteria bacterium]|nr:hypothetical protein [Alphaproteobacteria bacterium]